MENKEEPTAAPKAELDPDTKRFVDDLSRRFGTKISVVKGAKKGGKVVFDYYDDDDLNRLLDIFGGADD